MLPTNNSMYSKGGPPLILGATGLILAAFNLNPQTVMIQKCPIMQLWTV